MFTDEDYTLIMSYIESFFYDIYSKKCIQQEVISNTFSVIACKSTEDTVVIYITSLKNNQDER